MRHYRESLALLSLFVGIVACAAAYGGTPSTEVDRVYDQLVGIKLDLSAGATVYDLDLVRDVGRLHLDQGQIYGCTPVDGRRVAVLFVGTGTFTMKPPTAVEQQQLVRFYGQDSIRMGFKRLFLMFADTTWEQLTRRAVFTAVPDPRINDVVPYCLKYLHDKSTRTFQEEFMLTFLHHQKNQLFHAHISDEPFKPFFFSVNPFAEEEISFAQRGATEIHYSAETVSQFHTRREYLMHTAGRVEDKAVAAINDYRIAVQIEDNRDFSATAGMTVTSSQDSLRWIPFFLFSKLDVDSVRWGTGERLQIVRNDDSPLLWVRLPQAMNQGAVCSLSVAYHGDVLELDPIGWIGLMTSSSWYPRIGYHAYANFDLSFRTPAKWEFVSVGERLSSVMNGDTLITRWRSVRPMRNASFSIGPFKRIELEGGQTVAEAKEGEGLPNVSVLAFNNTPAGYGFADLGSEVRADMLNCMRFFQHVYGKSPVKDFTATEIPYDHGEAFPGLIHLSWSTFKESDQRGWNEVFRAHEVAHQWWGVGVGYRTYHDQWLSEGIAHYSGLWFMQTVLRNNDKFFAAMDHMKKRILGARQYMFSSGQESGPIWLGYRTQSSETIGDYDLIVYQKGAWVMHMLRSLMVDLQTFKEDKFIAAMREFYEQFMGKEARTVDFQRVIEKHFGASMEWFFKQWVMDTKVPKYTFAYKTVKMPDGKFESTCRITQANVGSDFLMPVPLLLKFEGGKFYRLRLIVKGDQTEYKLPLLPLEPEEIIFNDLNAVLCEVDNEDWD
jgi:hypothetical protein